ncbi:hypothetical protein [Cupriavidus oxalaticus]|uniref:Uncharacterized protein n=1 Tax=Cupriavidus oxalaticus TaxID=96344 RepID=A0A4P7LH65_9BURK|nr:hypothetical protein [Cupriavidus oxalaticus]QBY55470.1 hypothetical protein E0W60_31010 [Cupriavidus oxalaticus]
MKQWHRDQSFPAPTKALLLRNVVRGIGSSASKPLRLVRWDQVVYWLDATSETARAERFAIALREGITCCFPQTKSDRHYLTVRLQIESARRPVP